MSSHLGPHLLEVRSRLWNISKKLAAFDLIASYTCGDQIFEIVFSAVPSRLEMIDLQKFPSGKTATVKVTVPTFEFVTREDFAIAVKHGLPFRELNQKMF